MSDYCAFLSNCLAIGVQRSQSPKGGWIRDKIEWNLGHYKVILQQNEPVITQSVKKLSNKWIDSSKVIISNVALNKISEAENIAKDLAYMLSFAGMSQVWVYGYEYPMGSGKKHCYPKRGVADFYRPTFDITDGSNIENFINQCWPTYRKLKRKRKLNVVFEVLIFSVASLLPLEIRLVSLFMVLESLKDTFAKSKGIPYHKGFYRKVGSPPRSNLSKEPKYSFEELLSLMLKEKGIRKGLKRIIRLRNDLIHSCVSKRPYNSQLKTFENCHEIIRKYILSLLAYKGSYCSYERPNSLLQI